MDTVRQITNELAIAGQPTLDELRQLAEAGYRSVMNLRSLNEIGFLNDEQQTVDYLGLRYINVSISKNLNLNKVLLAVHQLNQLPTPILVHCDSGIRSSIVVLIKLLIGQEMKSEEALHKVMKLGLLSHPP